MNKSTQLEFACPECGAAPWHPCLTSSGKARSPHNGRSKDGPCLVCGGKTRTKGRLSRRSQICGPCSATFTPEQIAAHNAVEMALRAGNLVRQYVCSICGVFAHRIEGHHANGYAPEFRLDVQWVCPTCHRAVESPSRYESEYRRSLSGDAA